MFRRSLSTPDPVAPPAPPRSYRWRLRYCDGGHQLDQVFHTPAAAGRWRRDNLPGTDAPLSLMAVEGKREVPLRAEELAECHWAWLWEPRALDVDCPVCAASAGEPCLPFSLTRPHAARERLAAQNAPAAADDGAGA